MKKMSPLTNPQIPLFTHHQPTYLSIGHQSQERESKNPKERSPKVTFGTISRPNPPTTPVKISTPHAASKCAVIFNFVSSGQATPTPPLPHRPPPAFLSSPEYTTHHTTPHRVRKGEKERSQNFKNRDNKNKTMPSGPKSARRDSTCLPYLTLAITLCSMRAGACLLVLAYLPALPRETNTGHGVGQFHLIGLSVGGLTGLI
ncbi:hypothetical protein B0J18DRAFT_108813 [Chaetomium sp. MPI-SDFR-AT-0129]|nr:hypothetical protein B0J18DRAFT_108813 [Chaetomium sp. MPI-SDFR-AT-0129]